MGEGGLIGGKAVLEALKSMRADDGATCVEVEVLAIAEDPEKNKASGSITVQRMTILYLDIE